MKFVSTGEKAVIIATNSVLAGVTSVLGDAGFFLAVLVGFIFAGVSAFLIGSLHSIRKAGWA